MANRFRDRNGFCTVYAHACGYLDTAEKDGDKEFVVMGAEGAVYFVKCRGSEPAWDTFERNSEGRKAARRQFLHYVRTRRADRWHHLTPEYSAANPKLDFYGHDGQYLYSSNWYKSVAHAWSRAPGRSHVAGLVGSIKRSI